jgi:hypothetical protein
LQILLVNQFAQMHCRLPAQSSGWRCIYNGIGEQFINVSKYNLRFRQNDSPLGFFNYTSALDATQPRTAETNNAPASFLTDD